MRIAIAAALLVLAPALASAADMTCAEFTAMDATKQAETAGMMHEEMAAGSMMSGAMAEEQTPEQMAMAAAESCEGKPDMMLGDAMMMEH
jgi:hypothetical protein